MAHGHLPSLLRNRIGRFECISFSSNCCLSQSSLDLRIRWLLTNATFQPSRHSTHSTQCTPRSSPEDHSTLLPPLYTFSPPSGSSGSCQRPPRPLSPPKSGSFSLVEYTVLTLVTEVLRCSKSMLSIATRQRRRNFPSQYTNCPPPLSCGPDGTLVLKTLHRKTRSCSSSIDLLRVILRPPRHALAPLRHSRCSKCRNQRGVTVPPGAHFCTRRTASSRRPSPVSTPPPTSYRKRASSTESE